MNKYKHNTKTLLLTLILSVLLLAITPHSLNATGGSSALLRLSTSKSSAVANGSDAITLSIYLFWYECSGFITPALPATPYHPTYTDSYDASSYCSTNTGNPAYSEVAYFENNLIPVWDALTISGSDVNFSPSTFVNTAGTVNTVTSNITSSKAGSKTITIGGYSNWSGHDTVTVNFTAVPTNTGNTSTTGSSTASGSANSQPAPSASVSTPPTIPVLKEVTVGDNKILANKIEGNQFSLSDKKIFAGITIPNGIVHLYFHSDPFEGQATANKDGYWSYELKQDIGTGDHTLQIAVTDPTTKLTSGKSQLTKFSLIGSAQNDKTKPIGKSNLPWLISGGIVGALAIAGIAFLVLKKKHTKA